MVNEFMQHIKTKHGSLAYHGAEFFKRKAEIVKNIRLDSCGSYLKKNAAVVEASYLVPQRIAKAKIPYSSRIINTSL
jgi:hypothetical protein